MGLFSFLKNSGSKIFNKKEAEAPTAEESSTDSSLNEALNKQRAAMLKGAVIDLGIHVENLEIEVTEDEVTVHGQAKTQADREKVILALGNVDGVSTVDDRISVTEPTPEANFYEVKKGDSLWKISKDQYGDGAKYMIIFEANKPMLKDPDAVYPGQVLRIPPLS